MGKLYADWQAVNSIQKVIDTNADPVYTQALKSKSAELMIKDVLGIRGLVDDKGFNK